MHLFRMAGGAGCQTGGETVIGHAMHILVVLLFEVTQVAIHATDPGLIVLGIGKIHEQGSEYLRFMHLSKNKLHGDKDSDPQMRHGRWQVFIRPEIARYVEIGQG